MGVLRDAEGMLECLRTIDALERERTTERFRNVLTTAKMMTVCALRREESRGGHFRTDMPDAREAWRRRTFLTLEEAEREATQLLNGVPARAVPA